ncbi:STAS domain-containing protein [Streptomyces montanus]|nr:STAS domain-containing protein [Streptomyces montanus]
MAMTLFLASHWEKNGWAVMEVRGILDTGTAPELRDSVASVIKEGRHPLRLIVDLSELSYTDVDGLSTLMAVRTLLREGKGELRLVCPEGRVLRILQISRLAHAVPVYPTLGAALAVTRTAGADRTRGAVR